MLRFCQVALTPTTFFLLLVAASAEIEECDTIDTVAQASDAADEVTLLQRQIPRKQSANLAGRSLSFVQAKEQIQAMPLAAWRAFQDVAKREKEKLEEGAIDGAKPQTSSVFESVGISLPLTVPILMHDPKMGDGQGDKNIVGLHHLANGDRNCLVYGIGIAHDSRFEQQMAQSGCEVHAFDCTVDPNSKSVANKNFTFHPWCIGQRGNTSVKNNNYFKGDEHKFQFRSLAETMKWLNHGQVDLLKFDIEGFEWQLFATEILPSQNLPEQLSFELHTQQANPRFVPMDNVKSKDFVAVNKLFLNLYNMGYRVVSKEINSGDPACAEFVLLNVHE
eukprot:gnl/TRDRNA2_/TRDRNA2_156698_c0_seq4.p1 gnl/TRDRNA2_/TRDRNA2_156698_c0~~gnl/TRDRNA2_/TRDRNA2_156698_c0_seq4.p1  ORF type:complete len:334 (+),score=67.53 gnl/TRDRNA2_/TRDRNA2_156698_c0_seq4:85-1086(+)